MNNQFDRARDAEMALLGGMLANSRMPEVATLSTLVDSSDFSDKSLGKLFAMLLEMQDDGHAISDVGLVRQRAIDSGIFDEIGGRTVWLKSSPRRRRHLRTTPHRFASFVTNERWSRNFSSRSKN